MGRKKPEEDDGMGSAFFSGGYSDEPTYQTEPSEKSIDDGMKGFSTTFMREAAPNEQQAKTTKRIASGIHKSAKRMRSTVRK